MGRGQKGGLVGIIGKGVGFAAEYHEHRKEQKLLRENSRESSQQGGSNDAVAGPSTSGSSSRTSRHVSREAPSSSNLAPPAYTERASSTGERSLSAGPPTSMDKKAGIQDFEDRHHDEYSDDDDSSEELELDEEEWQLDEAQQGSNDDEPPSYAESQSSGEQVDTLVREVLALNTQSHIRHPTDSTPLPCPVVIPQRRPGSKKRGFVRAYAPLLGECKGIDQDTFLAFLKNFYTASQASPVFGIIQLAAGIAGLAPSVIAMAVTTSVQIAAQVGEEVHQRYRTNSYLDRMNEEMFKPIGLYAMIVKYKSDQDIVNSGNSLLSRFGVAGEKVDLQTNERIAKYDRSLSGNDVAARSINQKMQNLRVASGTTRGAMALPESAPLVFPDLDRALVENGPETFKDKKRDFGKFVGRYMDKRAQMKYAQNDPVSGLALPEDQYQFKSKYSDPNHPMFNGGLIGLVSGGYLSRGNSNQQYGGPSGYDGRGGYGGGPGGYMDERQMRRDERRANRHGGRRMDRGYGGGWMDDGYGGGFGGGRRSGRRGHGGAIGLVGSLVSAAIDSAQNGKQPAQDPRGRDMYDEYDDPNYGRARSAGYGAQPAALAPYGSRTPSPYDGGAAPYGGGPAPYGGRAGYGPQGYGGGRQQGGRRGGGGSMLGRIMQQDVLYLMIVNMPSEAELAEARQALGRVNSGG